MNEAAFKYGPHVALIIAVLCFCVGLCAQEMPSWVLPGMLHIETTSKYGENGIVYRNTKRGTSGEVGPFQCLPATLRDFKLSPSLVEQDSKYAEAAAIKILSHYYSVTKSWEQAVGAWRKGLGKRNSQTALSYIQRVKDAGAFP